MRTVMIAVALSTPMWTYSAASAQQIVNVPTSQAKTDTALLLRDSSGMSTPGVPISGGSRTLSIPAGETLRVTVPKGFRVRGRGQPVTATLTQPLFAGGDLAIAPGAILSGYVSSIINQDKQARVGRLLSGDFTPPHVVAISFDRITMHDGTTIPIQSQATQGQEDVKTSVYRSKKDRPGIKAQVRDQVKGAVHTPNKMQRLTEAAVTSLPYHPEYINQGTVYDVSLAQPLAVPDRGPLVLPANAEQPGHYLHLRLLTPIGSAKGSFGQSITAVLSEPYFNSSHQMVYPAGLRIVGKVESCAPAGWLGKHGSLMFAFTSVEMPDNSTRRLAASVHAVDASQDQALAVGEEGDLKATTSRMAQVTAPLSLMGPSRAAADNTTVKTAWSRAGEGRKGMGFLGSGAAQASAGAAIGLGYYGAARKLYAAFVAKGSDVSLPVNTPIVLQVQD
jgi:hypothetical protein